MTLLAVVAALGAAAAAAVRWLRVAQREHYLPGSVSRFAWRWWSLGANRLLALAPLLGVVLGDRAPLAAAVGSVALAAGPFGLSLRGRTSKLVLTRRLKTLAGVWAGLHVLLLIVAALLGVVEAGALLLAVLVPVTVDLGLVITRPLEDRLAQPFVKQASLRLKQVRPVVVGITGSFGKTTTKGYLAHLLAGSKQVVPSPRSFNNRAGLARAVNEHLALGTEVFIAEMGTYGPGEIAELVSWVPPEIAVITAIGPVHLERMKSEETISRAKAEIIQPARVAVLNIDNDWLAKLAVAVEVGDKRVVRCSGVDRAADVSVIDGVVRAGTRELGRLRDGLAAAPTNVACAVAAALELGIEPEALTERLPSLPVAEHRLSVTTASTGFTILDDTFNANPAGASAGLAALARHAGPGHRRVLVTPGMVELGPRQHDENRALAEAAGRTAQCTHLVIVGHTNRRALLEGARRAGGSMEIVLVETRDEAVAWVREHVSEGDAVLYENDLPDHYP